MVQNPPEILQLAQCIGDERTYASSNGQLIIGTHVDDLIGIAPTESDLGKAEKSAEKPSSSTSEENH